MNPLCGKYWNNTECKQITKYNYVNKKYVELRKHSQSFLSNKQIVVVFRVRKSLLSHATTL